MVEFTGPLDKVRMRQDIEALFRDNALDITHCAHIAVDVQPSYCGYYNRIARRIARTVSPAFNKAGIPTYWMSMRLGGPLYKKIVIAKDDRQVEKRNLSSFENTHVDDDLRAKNKKILFIDGFSVGACIDATVRDAANRGYHTVLMTDCIDRLGPNVTAEFQARNVHLIPSDVVLSVVDQMKPAKKSIFGRFVII